MSAVCLWSGSMSVRASPTLPSLHRSWQDGPEVTQYSHSLPQLNLRIKLHSSLKMLKLVVFLSFFSLLCARPQAKDDYEANYDSIDYENYEDYYDYEDYETDNQVIFLVYDDLIERDGL